MIPNPWILLGAVLAWLASLVGVGYWQHQAGAVAERVAWQGKQTAELATANRQIQQLETAARAAEASHAAGLAAIGADYETKLQTAEDRRRADVASLRAGTLRLRVPGACPVRPDTGAAAETPAAAGQRDGPTTGELPPAVAGDLLDIAADADQVADQLAACQAIIRSDRSEDSP